MCRYGCRSFENELLLNQRSYEIRRRLRVICNLIGMYVAIVATRTERVACVAVAFENACIGLQLGHAAAAC